MCHPLYPLLLLLLGRTAAHIADIIDKLFDMVGWFVEGGVVYGKHFESMYEGSMYGAGLAVFAVWGYVIAHVKKSRVELNPKRMADTLGGEEGDIVAAIEFLMRPDPNSRHKECDGRRLVKEGQFQYFLPSWEAYRAIRNADDRREYNRVKQREYRAKKMASTAREREFVKAVEEGDETGADRLVDGAGD